MSKLIMKQKIHIFGASGSGTTTLAKSACDKLKYKHFDSDNYFWLQTDEPFTIESPREECLKLMKEDLLSSNNWILSGSLSGWGDIFIPYFDLVVFVYVPQDARLERLKKREHERYGNRILPGGDRYEASKDFLEWAEAYDTGTKNGRSLPKHEVWLKTVDCPVIRIINQELEKSIENLTNAICN
jgi:adenylate kinase family enzyme